MKTDPRYGYYPWWPENGDAWLHPEDVSLARTLIPSPRVFTRDGESGPFVILHYGEVRLRVKRTLWQEVPGEGFEIGDWVEVLSRMRTNDPRTAVICERHWDERERGLRYQVAANDAAIPRWYAAIDLQHVEPPQIRETLRIEPQADDGADAWGIELDEADRDPF
ncbi:MAG: hypothetical protein CMJ58_23390 [Planctomycetaceae bacterium]|nr:hypothetical protein [Planctomycetaceae bacterium]